MAQPSKDGDHLGVSFHRTFALRRASVRQVLDLAIENAESGTGSARAWVETSLGTVDAQASCRYALGLGLLDKRYRPTPFGRHVHLHDPGLDAPQTQWAMHYNMVAPHRHGPAFWGHLSNRLFQRGGELTASVAVEELERFMQETAGKQLARRTKNRTAKVFLQSYAESDGLASLGVLSKLDEGEEKYYVEDPTPPSWGVLAYVLADYWSGVWGDQKVVDLDLVTGPGGPADLLLLGSGPARMLLKDAQSRGLLQMQRAVAPYHVERHWDSPESLLEYLYA